MRKTEFIYNVNENPQKRAGIIPIITTMNIQYDYVILKEFTAVVKEHDAFLIIYADGKEYSIPIYRLTALMSDNISAVKNTVTYYDYQGNEKTFDGYTIVIKDLKFRRLLTISLKDATILSYSAVIEYVKEEVKVEAKEETAKEKEEEAVSTTTSLISGLQLVKL